MWGLVPPLPPTATLDAIRPPDDTGATAPTRPTDRIGAPTGPQVADRIGALDGPRVCDRIRALDGPHVADRIRALDRVRLRRAAKRYAAEGWPVFPGARLARGGFACGRPGCPVTSCHPAVEDWETAASCEVGRVADWWRDGPYGLLLATGRAFDVLEVPAHLGRGVLAAAVRVGSRQNAPASHRAGPVPARWRPGARRAGAGADPGPACGPVAVTPTGRWMFLVRPGEPLRPELDECFYVLRHGRDSWIPAPPTRLREGTVRWAVPPRATGWRLPDSGVLQRILVETLRAAGRTLPSAPLPGQVPPPLLPEPLPPLAEPSPPPSSLPSPPSLPGPLPPAPPGPPLPAHRASHRAAYQPSYRSAPAEPGPPARRDPGPQRSAPVRARHRA